jgi:hypothetical protein
MGLDMYLNRKRYIKRWDHMPAEQQYQVTLTLGGKPIALTNPSYLTEEVMYWRKANAIHAWFVRNVQDGRDECQESYVELDKLRELVDVCNKVLANKKLAPTLLPSQSGFFFGGTEYDEWYFDDLQRTVDTLTPIIAEQESSDEWADLSYQSSW